MHLGYRQKKVYQKREKIFVEYLHHSQRFHILTSDRCRWFFVSTNVTVISVPMAQCPVRNHAEKAVLQTSFPVDRKLIKQF